MSNANHKTISPKDAQDMLASGEAILIDVREPDEFKNAHISYAYSIPLSKVGQIDKFMKIGKDKKIIFQCLAGKRGEQACVVASTLGLENDIYNMEKGINGWESAGLPVVRSNSCSMMSIFRQMQIIIGTIILLLVLCGYFFSPWFYIFSGLIAFIFALAGVIGACPMMQLLKKMPWNNKGA